MSKFTVFATTEAVLERTYEVEAATEKEAIERLKRWLDGDDDDDEIEFKDERTDVADDNTWKTYCAD